MTPQFQQYNGGDDGMAGDCVRACIASILDMPMGEVPHFAMGGDGTMHKMIDMFLEQMNLRLWTASYSVTEEIPLSEILYTQAVFNPDAYYMVTGVTQGGGAHMVVAQNDRIIHDPGGMPPAFLMPHSPREGQPDYHFNVYVVIFRGKPHGRVTRVVR